MRAGPTSEHAIVATAAAGDELVIDARAGAWLHATTPAGQSGWVHESLLGENIQRDAFAFKPDPGIPTRQRTLHAVLFTGMYAADREDNGFLVGGRMGYALTSRFAIEVGAGRPLGPAAISRGVMTWTPSNSQRTGFRSSAWRRAAAGPRSTRGGSGREA